jgi:hypothetical protein
VDEQLPAGTYSITVTGDSAGAAWGVAVLSTPVGVVGP